MSEIVSGSIVIRKGGTKGKVMDKGESNLNHRHNFSHTHYVPQGGFLVEALNPTKYAEDDNGKPIFSCPIEFDVIYSREVWNYEWENHVEIPAGVWHRMTALVDHSRGDCIYSHRIPQKFVEHVGKNAEYDAAFAVLSKLAEELFGDVVQQYTGWQKATS